MEGNALKRIKDLIVNCMSLDSPSDGVAHGYISHILSICEEAEDRDKMLKKRDSMTFLTYLKEVKERHLEERTWRLGQTYFNVLYQIKPDLANIVRGSLDDPFHNDHRIGAFLARVCESWDEVK